MHGDLCSAFQFALFAASETAGKKTIRVGALDYDTSRTPFQRHIHEMEQNRQQDIMEREFFGPEDTQGPLREIMYELGRTDQRFK